MTKEKKKYSVFEIFWMGKSFVLWEGKSLKNRKRKTTLLEFDKIKKALGIT